MKLAILILSCLTLKGAIIDPYRFSSAANSNNLSSGLQAYYRFEETSGNPQDSSGNARHLTQLGTVESTTGKLALARSHDSDESADGFNIADAAWNSLGTADFTIAFWFKPTDATLTSYASILLGKANFEGTDAGWSFEINPAKTALEFRFCSAATGGNLPLLSINFQGGLNTSMFYFVIVYRDGNDFQMWLAETGDGGLFFGDSNDTTSEPEANDLADLGQPLAVGFQYMSDLTTPDPLSDFDGVIDELGWWNRALTECEYYKLFNAGAGRLYTTFDSNACQ